MGSRPIDATFILLGRLYLALAGRSGPADHMAGDPQWNNATKRMREGIPVGTGLLNQLRQIAQVSAAPRLLS